MPSPNATCHINEDLEARPVHIRFSPEGLHLRFYQLGQVAESQLLPWSALQVYERLQKNKGQLILQREEVRYQLELTDKNTLNQIQKHVYKYLPHTTPQRSPGARTWKRIGYGVGLIGLIALLWFFVLLPLVVSYALPMIPESTDRAIGQTVFTSLMDEAAIDTQATERLIDFYNQLNFPVAESYQLVVVKEEKENAFALPGGFIVVYDGILKKLDNAEELAGLLAHETIHVRSRHGMLGLVRAAATYVGFAVLTGDAGRVSATVMDNADRLLSLQYSRSLEQEADTAGARMLLQRGLSPQGMISLFEKLKEAHKDEAAGPDFLATHPALDSRMTYLRELVNEPRMQRDTSGLHQIFSALKKVVAE